MSSLISLLATLNTRPVIIALTETWLRTREEKFLTIPHYKLLSSPRTSGRGGGVGFCIDENIQFAELKSYKPQEEIFESTSIKIIFQNSKNIVISCMYCPLGTDVKCFINELDIFLASLNKDINRKLFCLVGDFNLNLLNMDAHSLTFDYYNLLCSNRLLPTITKPMRITDHTATLIDNIFINVMNRSMKATILYDDLSDHFPILLEIAINSNRKANYDQTKI